MANNLQLPALINVNGGRYTIELIRRTKSFPPAWYRSKCAGLQKRDDGTIRGMKRVLLLLPLLLLAACEPAEPTATQLAEKLQVQINELLDEVDESLEKVADLDLDGLCAKSGRITAGMDLLVPRYRAFAVLMEELGDMQQALLAGGAANQFAVDVQKIRRDCATRVAAPPSQPESSVNQSADKTVSEDEDLAFVTNTEENPSEQSPASDTTSPRRSPRSQEAMVMPE